MNGRRARRSSRWPRRARTCGRCRLRCRAASRAAPAANGWSQRRAGNRRRREIAQDELRRGEVEGEQLRVAEDIRVVRDGAVERPAAAIVAHPGQREVLVGALRFGEARVLVEVSLVVVNAEQHPHALAGVGLIDAEELVPVIEALPAKGLVYRMGRVLEFDEDMLGIRAVICPPGADHQPELGPILHRARPLGEGDEVPWHAHHPTAAVHELDEALSQGRVGEKVADTVLKNTASNCRRLSGRNTSGSRLTTASNAPVLRPSARTQDWLWGWSRARRSSHSVEDKQLARLARRREGALGMAAPICSRSLPAATVCAARTTAGLAASTRALVVARARKARRVNMNADSSGRGLGCWGSCSMRCCLPLVTWPAGCWLWPAPSRGFAGGRRGPRACGPAYRGCAPSPGWRERSRRH